MRDTIQEYDIANRDTWVPMAAPASLEEIESVQAELTRIGGRTPIGTPWLMLRWGATHTEWIAGAQRLKYWLANTEDVCTGYYYRTDEGQMVKVGFGDLSAVPEDKIALPLYEHQELGERRWIIEQWRSLAFMTESGRSAYTHDNLPELVCCRVCDTPKAERGDACVECGSRGEYETKGDGRRLLPDIDGGGHYDFFMRLEGRRPGCEMCDQGVCADATHSTYRPAVGRYLQAVAAQWTYQQTRSHAEKAADNAKTDVRITVCNYCFKEIEHMKKCPYCGGTSQSDMTPKTLDAQRRIWSEDNIRQKKDEFEQAARKEGPQIAVPANY